MKRIISLVCAAVLITSMFAGCGSKPADSKDTNSAASAGTTVAADTKAAGGDEGFKEHYSYECYSLDDNPDFLNMPMVKEAMKKFNVDFKINLVPWDNWDQKTRTLVAANSLPEALVWYNLNYGEYVNWAKQGVFKAFPDLSKYPNLDKLTKDYKIYDKVKVDGKLYAFPKVIVSNPYNELGTDYFVFRKDYAKLAGYDFQTVQEITWDDLVKYLKDIKQKDPAKLGDKFIPLDTDDGGRSLNVIMRKFNTNYDKYIEKDGKYVLGATLPETMQGLNVLKDLYSQGLLAKDMYTYKQEDGIKRFQAGRTGVIIGNYNVQKLQETVNAIRKINPNFKDEDLGAFVVKQADGKVHGAEKVEWWGSFAFSSSIDDKKMDRFLQIGDWTLNQDSVEKFAYGVPDVDWIRNGDKVELKWPKDASGAYSLTKENGKSYIEDQRKMLQKWFILEGGDVWLPGNPGYSSYLKTMFKDCMEKSKSIGVELARNNYDVDFLSAPNKDKYGAFSNEMRDNLMKAVVAKDSGNEWNKFIKTIEPKIKAVEADINNGLKK